MDLAVQELANHGRTAIGVRRRAEGPSAYDTSANKRPHLRPQTPMNRAEKKFNKIVKHDSLVLHSILHYHKYQPKDRGGR